jgi:hypothetical protein
LPLNDHDLRSELHDECDRLDGPRRPAVLGGPGAEGYDAVSRLYELRDEALVRGLPLPSNCPTDRLEH